MNLPPDPDQSNDSRAAFADSALKSFALSAGMQLAIEGREAVSDLLTDLMHWCDRNDVSFKDAYENGLASYEAETTAPETDEPCQEVYEKENPR